MPRYDFKCETCGHTHEESMSMAQAGMTTTRPCGRGAKCNGKATRVAFYVPAGIHFKGPGWETNDHKKGKPHD